jgi:ABC-type uncharacterized transport system permease subunit
MFQFWLRLAAVLYVGASVAVFPAVLYSRPRWRKICVHLGGLGIFFHFVSAVEMLAQAHRWLPVGAREVESLMGLAVAALFFIVWWIYDAIAMGIFVLPLTVLLVLAPAVGPGGYIFPSAGIRVGWLVAHIAALMVAYTALAFSMLASLLYLVQELMLKQKPKLAGPAVEGRVEAGRESFWPHAFLPLRDWLPPLDTLERIAVATLEFGFPCMTIGLVIGCLLVQETSLGAAYFRDPKIVAAFISWVVYVLLLLVRRGAGLRGRKAAYLTGTVVMAMVVVWATNFISQVHRYGAQ